MITLLLILSVLWLTLIVGLVLLQLRGLRQQLSDLRKDLAPLQAWVRQQLLVEDQVGRTWVPGDPERAEQEHRLAQASQARAATLRFGGSRTSSPPWPEAN